jgi:hypothetical protein
MMMIIRILHLTKRDLGIIVLILGLNLLFWHWRIIGKIAILLGLFYLGKCYYSSNKISSIQQIKTPISFLKVKKQLRSQNRLNK